MFSRNWVKFYNEFWSAIEGRTEKWKMERKIEPQDILVENVRKFSFGQM